MQAAQALLAGDVSEAISATSPAVWDVLRGRSIFLTGGTGFVGKWLMHLLTAANGAGQLGMRLTVLTRDAGTFTRRHPELAQAAGVTLHQGDVATFTFPHGHFDYVLHAALPVATLAGDGNDLAEKARAGLERVCAGAAQAGALKLLHVSSGAVYGAQPAGQPIHESAAWTDPAANDYTRAKRAAEDVCARQWPFEVVIARCFAFAGPYLEPASGSAAAQFIEAAAQGRDIVIKGNGEPVRSYQYAADMARWLISMLALAPGGSVLNVGSGQAVTIRELALRVAEVAGHECEVKVLGAPGQGLAGNAYLPSVALARDRLGLENTVGLDEAIRRTLAWRKSVQASEEVTT